ncbi:DUF421 domain-containing protein [Aridibaculum aurantiacum]|uniref:DUF421 domain-containing protein n=1 Tax=Aridibaculum aurantiacum TaxID=2810307 RepID=UPI001A970BDF|nr:YetF domain-containing protein [Aridibaculum aurantiacum]
MKPEEISLYDWARIFAGNVPATFYIELVIRAALVYLLLMVSMRLLGKRMTSQISRLELAGLVSLAAAIGVPMLAPDRGILPAFIIAMVVVGVNKLILYCSLKSERFEEITQGNVGVLIQDAVLCYDMMSKTQITRERIFAQLRSHHVYHLGSVKRMYIEATGSFSVVLDDEVRPGLLILPENDPEFIDEVVDRTNKVVCKHCGTKKDENTKHSKCNNCGSKEWTEAVIEKGK